MNDQFLGMSLARVNVKGRVRVGDELDIELTMGLSRLSSFSGDFGTVVDQNSDMSRNTCRKQQES